jgi:hypothetical protein
MCDPKHCSTAEQAFIKAQYPSYSLVRIAYVYSLLYLGAHQIAQCFCAGIPNQIPAANVQTRSCTCADTSTDATAGPSVQPAVAGPQ